MIRHQCHTGKESRDIYSGARDNKWDRVAFSELVVVEKGGAEAAWGKRNGFDFFHVICSTMYGINMVGAMSAHAQVLSDPVADQLGASGRAHCKRRSTATIHPPLRNVRPLLHPLHQRRVTLLHHLSLPHPNPFEITSQKGASAYP